MEETVDKATEAQLREYDQAKVITSARIVRGDDGYVLVIRLTWKPGEVVIFNQRHKPRSWASLDRLIAHLGEVAPSIQSVELALHGVVPSQHRS